MIQSDESILLYYIDYLKIARFKVVINNHQFGSFYTFHILKLIPIKKWWKSEITHKYETYLYQIIQIPMNLNKLVSIFEDILKTTTIDWKPYKHNI